MSQEPQTKTISGEEYEALRASSGTRPGAHKTVTLSQRSGLAIVGVIVLCIISFIGGMSVQKHHTKATARTTTAASDGFSRQGGFGGTRRSGGIGQVTAVSDTSITISNMRTGASSTYSITSSTAIVNNGATVAASTITTSDTVLVTTSSSTSTVATRIEVNPSFGGGQGQPSASTTPTDTSEQSN